MVGSLEDFLRRRIKHLQDLIKDNKYKITSYAQNTIFLNEEIDKIEKQIKRIVEIINE